MRTLTQPGEPTAPRRVVRPIPEGRSLRVRLGEGADLLSGLTAALVARGITDAGVQLLGGAFSSMQYLTGEPDHTGQRVATYGAPTTLEGPVRLIGGNCILGRDAKGAPLLHCHAVVVDRDGGIHGGHLPAKVCRLGPGGVTALVTVLGTAGFQVAYDAETNYDIFQPASETPAPGEEAAQ
jgi:predicted DNA-binding protein with PD1-like motif